MTPIERELLGHFKRDLLWGIGAALFAVVGIYLIVRVML